MTSFKVSKYNHVLPSGTYEEWGLNDATEHSGPTTIRAVKPRKRDWWRVLRGKYTPQFVIQRCITVAGTSVMLKEHYTDKVREQLNQRSPLMSMLEEADEI